MAQENNRFLLLDSRGVPLAQAKPEGPASSGQLWQLRILDDKIDRVLEHKQFKLMSITDSSPSYEGTVVRSRNDIVQLEVKKTASNGNDLRKNLRVAVRVKTFLYPVTGRWRGRLDVETNDLSCGGVAFFCDRELAEREQVEIVIPVTSEPLVLTGEILRKRPTEREDCVLYAAKFIDMCNDEETLVREAVFNLQLSARPRLVERHAST